jgi:hypothetical protein
MNSMTLRNGSTVRMPFPNDSVIPFEAFTIGAPLPPGLTRDAETGVISGVPTTPGTYVVPIYNDRHALGTITA